MNQLFDTFSVSKINFGDIDGREEAKLDNFEELFYDKDNVSAQIYLHRIAFLFA